MALPPMLRLRVVLGWLQVVLVAGVVGYTLLHAGSEGTEITWQTVRGESAQFRGSGIYRFDPAAVAREGLIWDTINGLVGVPLLAIATWFAGRGSLRGLVVSAGFGLYFAYVYLMYATMSAFNLLFLAYVAIVAVSGTGFFLGLAAVDLALLASHLRPDFPRRLFAGYSFVTAAALLLLWTGRIVPMLQSGRFPPELAGMTTLETQAMDLGLIVPLMIATGVLLLRRKTFGIVLCGVVLTFGVMLDLTIPAWIGADLLRRGVFRPIEAIPLLLVALSGVILAQLYLRWAGSVVLPAPPEHRSEHHARGREAGEGNAPEGTATQHLRQHEFADGIGE